MHRRSSQKRSGFFSFILILTSVLCLAASGTAAEITATLAGTVKDSSGAVVVGAPVTLTNTKTNESRDTTTGKDGSYVFELIPIGTYQVSVQQPGFEKYVRTGITLQVNQAAKLDVVLKVGASSQVVEVQSDVAQVDTENATLGKVETAQRINDLPLVERDTFQLGLLQPGVFAPDPDDGSGNPFSVSGQRSESLTFMINGVDNNDFLSNNPIVDPNPDAVAEFKILTNNYTAEYGRTSGGIVNQVIKSGTNAFHGDLFEFLRNEDLNAADYFTQSRTVFKRNMFGGTVGGPIVKNKLFFFFGYQGNRRREGQVAPVLTVLTPQERTGDFSDLLAQGTQLVDPTNCTTDDEGNSVCAPYANNQVPVSPIIQNYINKYLPLPNRGTNQFVASPVATVNADQYIGRVDYQINSSNTLSGVYIANQLNDAYPYRIVNGASTGGDVPVGSGFTDSTLFQVFSLTYTHIFTNHLLNEAIFGTNRRASLQAKPMDTTSPSELGFTNVNPDDPNGTAPPIIFTPDFNLGPSPQGPTKEHDVTFQFADNLSWSKGRHDMKFGADIRRVRNNFNYDFFNNGSFDFGSYAPIGGSFTGSPLADFVGGFWDNYYQFSTAQYGIRTSAFAFYGQDTWRVTPKLTLTYGLRYEYYTPITDPSNQILGYFPGQQSTVFPDAPTGILYPGDPGTPNRGLTYPDKNNFAPRFGFAWDMLGSGKLVMRGGFGIFYDIEDGALNLQFGGQPPFGAVSNTYSGWNGVTGIDPMADPYTSQGLINPFPFASAGKIGTFAVPQIPYAYVVYPYFRTPYSENFNFGFQYQLTPDTMLEAVGVGSLGRKLITTQDMNFPNMSVVEQQYAQGGSAALNPDCARPAANCVDGSPTGIINEYTNLSDGLSDSYQLQVTVEKRFAHNWDLRAAYTWAKTIDLSSGFRARSSTFTDPYDHNFDRGLADFDVPRRLVLSGSWYIPFGVRSHGMFMRQLTDGWQVSAIAQFQSGYPFTLYSNDNSSQQNNFLDRPDILGPVAQFNPRTISTFNSTCLPGPTTGNFYIDPTNIDCANVPLFTFGNMRRNWLRGPGFNNWDISIAKKFPITESQSLEFRTEFFNAFNHTNFLNPNDSGFSGTFGQVTSDRGPRIIQFALKYYF